MNPRQITIAILLFGVACSSTPPDRSLSPTPEILYSFRIQIDGETITEPKLLVVSGEEAMVSIRDEAGRALTIEIDRKGTALCTVPIVEEGRSVARPQLLLEPGGNASWAAFGHRVEVTSTMKEIPPTASRSDGPG